MADSRHVIRCARTISGCSTLNGPPYA